MALVALGCVLVVLAVGSGTVVVRQVIRAASQAQVSAASQAAAPATPGAVAPSTAPSTAPPTEPQTGRPPDFTAALAAAKPAVVRVIASTCKGSGVGSGFLIAPDQVVASYPSVAESVATVVTVGDKVIPARVAGADPRSGVALLSLSRSLGSPLALGSSVPATGDPVLAVGLPYRSDDVAAAETSVGAPGGSVRFAGTTVGGLSRLPGSNDRGLTGAPVVDSAGRVVGALLVLPSTSARWLVGADQLTAGIERARSSSAPAAGCDRPTGPHSDTRIHGTNDPKLRKGLFGYFSGINSGDNQAAFRNLGPAYHTRSSSADDFDWTSTYDFDITVHKTWRSSGRRHAWVTFVAINDPSYAPKGLSGQWCARWSFDYELVDAGDRLLINNNPGHAGAKVKMRTC